MKVEPLSFKSAVEAVPDICRSYRKGLQALGNNAKFVEADNNRLLSGSVDIDASLKDKYPEEARWDYVVGYDERSYFIEVHPASTSNINEVVNKKLWLERWLEAEAKPLKAIKANVQYYWIPSGKVAILKNSKQRLNLAKKYHILIVKPLRLK